MKPEVQKAMLEYEQIKLNIKTLEAKADELKEIILPEVEVGKKYEATEGSFEVKSKALWRFSPRVEEMKKSVKEVEAEEIAKGIAVNNPTVYLEYRVKKS
jgi:hypothetical protein